MELTELYPPFGLRVRSGDLTLRLLRDEDLPAYAALLRQPIFEDESAEHVFPWYRAAPDERERGALQFHWNARASIGTASWTLALGVFEGQELIGQQDVSAREFARRRVVSSGSWLTRGRHGRGLGRLMRQAMLTLAFDHLGAARAESTAVVGNERSYGVSRACGYVPNGTDVVTEGDRLATHQRFVVTPETFVRPDVPVRVDGLTPGLLRMLGAQGGEDEPSEG